MWLSQARRRTNRPVAEYSANARRSLTEACRGIVKQVRACSVVRLLRLLLLPSPTQLGTGTLKAWRPRCTPASNSALDADLASFERAKQQKSCERAAVSFQVSCDTPLTESSALVACQRPKVLRLSCFPEPLRAPRQWARFQRCHRKRNTPSWTHGSSACARCG